MPQVMSVCVWLRNNYVKTERLEWARFLHAGFTVYYNRMAYKDAGATKVQSSDFTIFF